MTIEEIKLLVGLLILLGTSTISAIVMHKVDNAAYTKLELSYTQAKEKAVETALEEQSKLDEIKTQVALANGQKQRVLANQTREQLNEASKYIKSHCIRWGTIRVYQGVLLGVNPSSVSLPAGRDDDSCSGIDSIELTNNFINNIGICKATKQQVNSFIEFYQKEAAAQQKH